MPIKAADPEAQSLEAAFAEAMGAPARPKEPPAPADLDPEAPHGRDAEGNPLTPYGRTKDGAVRKSAAGRRAKEDTARVNDTPSPTGKGDDTPAPAALAEPGQYAAELADTATAIWFGMSALGKAGPNIPLVGKLIPGPKIEAQAAIWFATMDRAVAAVSLAAEHNAAAARFARKLQGGDVTWMITCISLVAPIVSLSGLVWAKDADTQLQEAGQPTIAELAERNEKAMAEAINQLTAQAAALAAQEVASMNGQAAA